MTDLVTNNVRGGSPALIRMAEGLTQEFLATIPGALEPTTTREIRYAHNRYAEINEKKFVLSNGVIYEWDGATGFTSRVTGVNTTTGKVSGFFKFLDPVNGVRLVLAHSASAATGMTLEIYDRNTDTWSQVVTTGGTGSTNNCTHAIMYDNLLYMHLDTVIGSSRRVFIIDCVTGVVQSTTTGLTDNLGQRGPSSLVGYNGIVYMLQATPGVGNLYKLRVLLGGNWIQLATLPDTGYNQTGGDTGDGLCTIYEQDGNIVTLCQEESGDGLKMYEWDIAGSMLTDVTLTKLHASLRPGGGLNNTSPWRMYTYKDNESPFGGSRTFLQLFTNFGIAGSIKYEHVAGGNVVLIGSSQWTGAQAAVTAPIGGSDYYSRPDDLTAKFEGGPTPDGSGVVLEFRTAGDPGNADKYARLWYSLVQGEPTVRATMTAPTSGGTGGASSVVSNQLQSVDCDDGTTLYRIRHDTSADGITPGTKVFWEIEISPNATP